MPIDLNAGMYSLYLYSDIVEDQLIGDVFAPLLRIVHRKDRVKGGDIISRTYENPHFVKVKMKRFDTIDMHIRRDTGEKISFQRGKVIVKLCFRSVRSGYFNRRHWSIEMVGRQYGGYVQSGKGSFPVFRGSRMQRGYGIGSVLSGMLRATVPFLRRGAQALGKQALRTGLDVEGDVLSGRKLKDSARQRTLQTVRNVVEKAGRRTVTRRRRPAQQSRPKTNKKKKGIKRRRHPDRSFLLVPSERKDLRISSTVNHRRHGSPSQPILSLF